MPEESGPGMAVTFEQLACLERYYTPASEQRCIVCGAPLECSGSDGGGSRYNCSSEDASPLRSRRSLRERIDHYGASAWRDRGQADALVVLLVKAYRALAAGAQAASADEGPTR
jgi:hypothetical protein